MTTLLLLFSFITGLFYWIFDRDNKKQRESWRRFSDFAGRDENKY